MIKRSLTFFLTACFFCGVTWADEVEEGGTAGDEEVVSEEEEWQPLSQGIYYQDLYEGEGEKPGLWGTVYVHYRLTAEDGTVLEDTYTDEDHGGRARKHVIGSGTMPEALELAVGSMRERGRRALRIPVELLELEDFHVQEEGEEHDALEHNKVVSALTKGTTVQGEMSLLWVRAYDPSVRNRFR